jgi:polyhydroxybutyrate depolymerase
MIQRIVIGVLMFASPALANDWGDLTPPNEVPVFLPPDYTPDESAPLIIFLHGWAPLTTGWYDILIPLQDVANERGFIFVKPNGSQDALGDFYWNATTACCDIGGYNPDHVGYLLAMVQSIQDTYNVDPNRIHLVGHSNGGFMSHRLACESTDTFASIVSIAGTMWFDESNCQPTEPIHVLQIHGTIDQIILWFGGFIFFNPYPGASVTAAYWATHNGCSVEATNAGSLDLDWFIPFAETTRWVYASCTNALAGSTELWQVWGGQHFIAFSAAGIDAIFDYIDTHVKQTPSCTGDLTGDGVVDVADLLDLLALFGSAEGDLDGDGVTAVSDLLMLLAAWGEC